jgi:ATP/maltotriose-dependent transcriptional regulator MalT
MNTLSLPRNLSNEAFTLAQGTIDSLLDGILILTEQQELIYANAGARRVLEMLNSTASNTPLSIPQEIWHLCQSLIHSRHLFPKQHWLIESDIYTHDATNVHICVRWLKVENRSEACLLLTVEDRRQAIKSIAIDECETYGLTRREKEVWLLHRNHYTYKQIAIELCITPNTVKKHMRSIHAKKKELL